MAQKLDDNLFEDKKYVEPVKMDDNLFDDSKVNNEPIVSELESGARGAAQGLTFGFADELTGAAEAALKVATGKAEVSNILDAYRKARDESRVNYKEAQKANPEIYLGGELVGGIAPALLTGGAGLAAQGLKTAVIQGAKAGAAYGAASGLGQGEADLTKGEIGKAALETGVGAAGGALVGAALPATIQAAKYVKDEAVMPLVRKAWDLTGQLGDVTEKAARMTLGGETVVSKKALEKTTQDIANSADELAKTVNDVTREKAKNLISESLNSEQKINLTDTVDTYIKKVDEALSKVVRYSSEAKTLGNIKASFTKLKSDLLKEAGQNPTLPTKQKAYQKLLEKKETLEAIQSTGAPQAQALDNLFNKAAKIKGDWKPGTIDAQRIQKDFQLPNEESAVEMLKDLAKLKLKKPTVDPVSGMVVDMPIELTQVIKKYSPNIIEKDGRLMLQTAPGKISKSDVLKFRPDEITQPINLTPQRLLNVRDELRGLTFGQEGFVKKIGSDISEGLTSKLKEGIGSDKQALFEKGNEIYKSIYDLEDLLGTQIKTGNRAEATQTIDKISNFIESKMTGLDPAQRMTLVNSVKDKIKTAIPELGDEFINKISKQSQLKELQSISHKIGSVRVAGTIESLGVKGGATLGAAIRKLEQGGNIISGRRYIDKLSNATSDQLKTISNEYRQLGKENVANFLDQLGTSVSSQKKNALLFSASQNPNLKHELFGDEENP